jgi:hypothetical protein
LSCMCLYVCVSCSGVFVVLHVVVLSFCSLLVFVDGGTHTGTHIHQFLGNPGWVGGVLLRMGQRFSRPKSLYPSGASHSTEPVACCVSLLRPFPPCADVSPSPLGRHEIRPAGLPPVPSTGPDGAPLRGL